MCVKTNLKAVFVFSLSFGGILGSAAADSSTVVDGVTWYYSAGSDSCSIKRNPNKYSGNLTVPAALDGYTVVSIESYAFSGCTGLTSIALPDTVQTIGGYAFNDCSSLRSVSLPANLQYLGNYAFKNCSSLGSVLLPDTLKCILASAFAKCSSLRSVSLPASVTQIGDSAFRGCSALQSVTIPGTVALIDEVAFEGCSAMTSLTIGEGTATIGFMAFSSCTSLSSVRLPSSLRKIDIAAFQSCTSLKSVALPEGLETIEASAFVSAGLESVVVPSSVKTIGDFAFAGCGELRSVVIPKGVTFKYGTYMSGYFFDRCGKVETLTFPADDYSVVDGDFFYDARNSLRYLVVSPGSVKLCAGAVSSFSQLRCIRLPASVTSIGECALTSCSNLKSVVFEGAPPSLDEDALYGMPGNVRGVYTGHAEQWAAAITDGYWNGIKMYYDPQGAVEPGSGGLEYRPSGWSDSLSVSYDWLIRWGLAELGAVAAEVGDDVRSKLSGTGANGKPRYESYLLDQSPDAEWRILASIDGFDAGGLPIVGCLPVPNDPQHTKLTVFGRADLVSGAAWQEVTDANRAEMRFFIVKLAIVP